MKFFRALAAATLLAGCAGYSGAGLAPGQSTEADVQRVMGTPAAVREASGGGKVLWYPRLPLGRESFAARMDAEGRLVALEQRLAPEYIRKLQLNKSTAEDVLDLLGPPAQVHVYPRQQREAWEYQLRRPPDRPVLYVQLSPDRVVREVFELDERLTRPPGFFGFD